MLQKLDARLKVVSVLLFLLAVNLSHNLIIIALLYASTLALVKLSNIPLVDYLKRVWLLVFIFTGVIALPSLFITPGPVWMQLPWGWSITRPGGLNALFLLLRSGTSISVGILFVLTTPWNSILKALGVLRIPDVILLILCMTYRYIHLLLHMTHDMYLSRKSRILKPLPGPAERQLLGATAGVLLGKSLQVSSEVYLAMESRGFRGYPRTLDTFHMRRLDWIFASIVTFISIIAIWLGQ